MEAVGERTPIDDGGSGACDKSTSQIERKRSPVPYASSKPGKQTAGSSLRTSVNRSLSQIRKHTRRSPVNWYPRKKGDSYLQRKIKHLQEVAGMNSSLDETLGGANLHYSKITREKIAAREAAEKAMEARKAAMVEASWCRMLHAARIHNKEAESELERAEQQVSEAFEAAASMGVMMYDKPDCQRWPSDVETSMGHGGRSTHTITASFETAFEVDRQVAEAVKSAFIKLANYPSSSNKEDLRILVRKMNQNPYGEENNQDADLIDAHSEPECESTDEVCSETAVSESLDRESTQASSKKGQESCSSYNKGDETSMDLVGLIFQRLQCMQDEQLASLAVVVATRGLNAALSEIDSNRDEDSSFTSARPSISAALPEKNLFSVRDRSRRYSIQTLMQGSLKKKEPTREAVSLDKDLVKHVSKLQREILQVKNSMSPGYIAEGNERLENADAESLQVSSSDSDVKHVAAVSDGVESTPAEHVSALERNIHEAEPAHDNNLAEQQGKTEESSGIGSPQTAERGNAVTENITSGASQSNCNNQQSPVVHQYKSGNSDICLDKCDVTDSSNSHRFHDKHSDKENEDVNLKPFQDNPERKVNNSPGVTARKYVSRIERAKQEALQAFNVQGEQVGLDKLLVKPVDRSDKTKREALEPRTKYVPKDRQQPYQSGMTASEGLDKILVKHVSRLERLKNEAQSQSLAERRGQGKPETKMTDAFESLDTILVKHVSKFDKMKMEAAEHNEKFGRGEPKPQKSGIDISESLDKVLVKHVTRLEKEKLAAIQLKEGSVPNSAGQSGQEQTEKGLQSLDEVLIKRQSGLEKAKLASAERSDIIPKYAGGRKGSRERELLEAWGGMSLESTMQPSLTRSSSQKGKNTLAEKSDIGPKDAGSRRQLREKELQDTWGGLSLGNAIKPSLSRLEREKAAWREAEEEERRRTGQI